MDRNQCRKIVTWLLPVLGTLFCVAYIGRASCDAVYSDYIRLIHSYLPDIYDLKKLLVPDVLTRIPINYLERIINVELFGYSVQFERILGAVFLGCSAWVLGSYWRQQRLGVLWFGLLTVVMFSLNKWEMLLNGSGWSHFLAFVGFYYHEIVLDRVAFGRARRGDTARLLLLPWLITLLTAGPYCASYSVVILLSYGYCFLMTRILRRPLGEKEEEETAAGRPWLLFAACALIPLLLYIWSDSYVIEEFAGATGRSLPQILADNPTFPIRFLLKSLAGIMVGGEELTTLMQNGELSNKGCYLIGFSVGLAYLFALWLNLRLRICRRSLLPLMLLAGGIGNHLLVFMARYIFEKEAYALNSSRYTLQFQVGVFGMIVTFAFAWRLLKERGEIKRLEAWACRLLSLAFCLAFLWGNVYTTYHEMDKARYRMQRYEQIRETVLAIPEMSDAEFAAHTEEIEDMLEYWNSPERIRRSIQILKEHHWNVFR